MASDQRGNPLPHLPYQHYLYQQPHLTSFYQYRSNDPPMPTGSLTTFDIKAIVDNNDVRQLEGIVRQVIVRGINEAWFQKQTLENKTKLINILQMTYCYNQYGLNYRSQTIAQLHQQISRAEKTIEQKKRVVKSLKQDCYDLKDEEKMKRASVKDYRTYLQSRHWCQKCNKYVNNITAHRARHLERQKTVEIKNDSPQIQQLLRRENEHKQLLNKLLKQESEHKELLDRLMEQNLRFQNQLKKQSEEIRNNKQSDAPHEQTSKSLKKIEEQINGVKREVIGMQSQMEKYPNIVQIIDEKLKPVLQKIEETKEALKTPEKQPPQELKKQSKTIYNPSKLAISSSASMTNSGPPRDPYTNVKTKSVIKLEETISDSEGSAIKDTQPTKQLFLDEDTEAKVDVQEQVLRPPVSILHSSSMEIPKPQDISHISPTKPKPLESILQMDQSLQNRWGQDNNTPNSKAAAELKRPEQQVDEYYQNSFDSQVLDIDGQQPIKGVYLVEQTIKSEGNQENQENRGNQGNQQSLGTQGTQGTQEKYLEGSYQESETHGEKERKGSDDVLGLGKEEQAKSVFYDNAPIQLRQPEGPGALLNTMDNMNEINEGRLDQSTPYGGYSSETKSKVEQPAEIERQRITEQDYNQEDSNMKTQFSKQKDRVNLHEQIKKHYNLIFKSSIDDLENLSKEDIQLQMKAIDKMLSFQEKELTVYRESIRLIESDCSEPEVEEKPVYANNYTMEFFKSQNLVDDEPKVGFVVPKEKEREDTKDRQVDPFQKTNSNLKGFEEKQRVKITEHDILKREIQKYDSDVEDINLGNIQDGHPSEDRSF